MGGEMSCVFRRNWMDVAQTIEDLTLRCQFYEAVIQYALNGMEMDAPPELKLALKLIYGLIDADREKYEKVCERRREAGKKGNNKRWGDKQDVANIANATEESQSMANVANTNTITDTNTITNTNTDTNDSKESILNNTPIPPKGGGWIKSFEDLCNRVSKVVIPDSIKEIEYELQYVWRMSEGNPGYGTSVARAIAMRLTKDELRNHIQAINSKYAPHSDFKTVKLAWLMQRLKQPQRVAVMAELERAAGEPNLFDTMLEKVEYIIKGNKVTSLAAFLKSRRQ